MKQSIQLIAIVILMFCYVQMKIYAAGIRLLSENEVTNVDFFKTQQQSDNEQRSGLPFYLYLNPGQTYSIDAGLDGFYSIEWTNKNGMRKKAILNILGITGWRDVRIQSNDNIYIGSWGLEQARTVNSFNY